MAKKLDWDREARERRARLHGGTPVWKGLVTGVADLRRRWRAEARDEIWVVPAPDERAVLVLLPVCDVGERWCVQFEQPGWALQEKHSRGGDPATVKFVYLPDLGFEAGIFVDDDQYAYMAFEDFWPSGDIWFSPTPTDGRR